MKEIRLTKGQIALVDDDDYEILKVRKWHSQPSSCGFAAVSKIDGKKVLMSRVIMNAPQDKHVDHKDGNRLNNQKSNLRLATVSQNQQNKAKGRSNTSGYKGVSRLSTSGRYMACIWVNKARLYLGSYKEPEDAARAYDEAAMKYFGEFARPNFPISPSDITDEDFPEMEPEEQFQDSTLDYGDSQLSEREVKRRRG